MDSGSNAHICTSMLGLIESKKLKECNMILRIGNEAKVAAEVISTYPLRLPSGFRLDLKDYYCVPVSSQNLIFVSMLA